MVVLFEPAGVANIDSFFASARRRSAQRTVVGVWRFGRTRVFLLFLARSGARQVVDGVEITTTTGPCNTKMEIGMKKIKIKTMCFVGQTYCVDQEPLVQHRIQLEHYLLKEKKK